jgi:hypothetical protein
MRLSGIERENSWRPIEYLTIQAFELEQNRLLFIYQKSGIYQRLLNKKKSF